MARTVCLLLGLVAAATLLGSTEAAAQTQEGDLTELWERYPLEEPAEDSRPAGTREEDGSKAGSPPAAPKRAGPFAQALLYLALALAVVGVAGGVFKAVGSVREQRRGFP
jgi:hypothetical protein